MKRKWHQATKTGENETAASKTFRRNLGGRKTSLGERAACCGKEDEKRKTEKKHMSSEKPKN
jgi:hypothetical protein